VSPKDDERDTPTQVGGLRGAISGDTLPAWDIKLRLFEVVITTLILLFTVMIGIQANLILSRQNSIVEKQAEADVQIGREQYRAALLQAYVSSAQAAGYETPQELRMVHVANELFNSLRREHPRYNALQPSLPALTEEQREDALRRHPQLASEIWQAYGRQIVTARTQDRGRPEDGPVHLVIGTFRQDVSARNMAVDTAHQLRSGTFHPQVGVWRNGSNFYLVTLSSFRSRDDALTTINREQLRTRFSDVYATQIGGLSRVCAVNGDVCN
jgi:hypothetical protein